MATSQDANPTYKDWLTMIALALIWGCSFILIKKGLVALEPTQVAALRMSSAGLVCLPFFFYYLKHVPKNKRILVYLTCGFSSVFPAFLFSTAQTHIDSGVTGALNTLSPIWTLILAVLFFKLKGNKFIYIGTFLAFAGALVLVSAKGVDVFSANIFYAGLIILATFCYGLTGNIVKINLAGIKPISISVAGYGFWTIPSLLFLFFGTDFVSDLETEPLIWQSIGAVAALGIVSTAICSFIFFILIQRTNAVFASNVAYIMPFIALLFGIYDGEPILFFHWIGMGLIILGLFVSNRKKQKS